MSKENTERDGLKPLKNNQLVVDPIKGDCFRACVTSLFGIPNTPVLPNGGQKDWWPAWHKFFSQYGLSIHYTETDIWRNGYWIASVKSQNFSDVTHAIIMHEQEVYFDPSPGTRYIEGENLLGKDVVLGGWYFEVENIPKFMNTRPASPSSGMATPMKELKVKDIIDKMPENPYPEDIFIPIPKGQLAQINELLKEKIGIPLDRLTGHIGRHIHQYLTKEIGDLEVHLPSQSHCEGMVALDWKVMLTELLNAKPDDYTEFGEVDFKRLCQFICSKFGTPQKSERVELDKQKFCKDVFNQLGNCIIKETTPETIWDNFIEPFSAPAPKSVGELHKIHLKVYESGGSVYDSIKAIWDEIYGRGK